MREPKILVLNLGNFGSTGTIARQIGKMAIIEGMSYTFVYPSKKDNLTRMDNEVELFSRFLLRVSMRINAFLGFPDLLAKIHTLHLLRIIKKNNPDIVHLHNLHGGWLDVGMLFRFFKKHSHIQIIWTLHDCWAFTGRCPHFAISKCEKWKDGCFCCPYPKNDYPQSKIDRTKRMWKLKKEWYSDMKNLTIVTPSHWLANLVKLSFLRNQKVITISNGIDLTLFKPKDNDFRKKYNVSNDKCIILGVSFGWGLRKGLDVFIELSNRLPEKYQIVLVGTDDDVDKQLPKKIISIHKTDNQLELAGIYSAADLFVNPTREDNFPTVNIESLSCGTPVLTFKTGGSPEIIDKTCGSVVECDDIDALEREIRRICANQPYSKDNCLKRALSFDMNDGFKKYINLYKNMKEGN